MSATDDFLSMAKALSKVDREIDALTERLVAKQAERHDLVIALRDLKPLRHRGGVGAGPGNHNSPRGTPKGTPNHKARSLKPAQVRQMRKLWDTGKYTQRELGERFGGLPQPTVSSIVHRRTYQDVS